jgi:hypothetical protein
MPDADKLTPADPSDLASALAFAPALPGRKRIDNADEIMAEIVAKRLVERLEHSGLVVMKRPAEIGAAALGLMLRQRNESDATASCELVFALPFPGRV